MLDLLHAGIEREFESEEIGWLKATLENAKGRKF